MILGLQEWSFKFLNSHLDKIRLVRVFIWKNVLCVPTVQANVVSILANYLLLPLGEMVSSCLVLFVIFKSTINQIETQKWHTHTNFALFNFSSCAHHLSFALFFDFILYFHAHILSLLVNESQDHRVEILLRIRLQLNGVKCYWLIVLNLMIKFIILKDQYGSDRAYDTWNDLVNNY